MKSQLKLGALLSYVVLGLQNLVGLVYTPFMLRMMGKSEFGLYSIAASVVAYLTILDLGFGSAVVRYTAKFRAEGKTEEQYKMFGVFFLLYSIIGLFAFAIGSIFYFNAECIFDASMSATELERTKIILLLMVVNLAITFPFSLFGSIIIAYEQFIFQKIVSIVRIVLNTATMIVLLNFGYKAIAMVVVTTIFNVVTLLSHYVYCRRKLKIKLKFGNFQFDFLKEIFIYSFWIFLNSIMDRVYWSTGQFVLGAFAGTAVVAVFAVGIQLARMYLSFSNAINGIFLPKVTAMSLNDGDGKAISDLFIKAGRLLYCVMVLILSGFFLFGQQFIRVWAGNDYAESYVIAMLFFVPLTIPLIQNLGLTILQARNQMKFLSLLGVFAAVFSIAIQIPLAKLYGGIGSAFGVAFTLFLVQGVVMNIYYKVKQKLDIVGFWIEIAKMSFVPVLLSIAAYFALQHFSLDSWHELGLGIAAYLAVYLPLFFMISMNKYEKDLVMGPIRKILKRN